MADSTGYDWIFGFKDGTDKIELEGLTFNELDIRSRGSSTVIKIASSRETLAILSGIDSGVITEADFI